MESIKQIENLYIYHTNACCDEDDCEFSVELYDFSEEEKTVGSPIKKITCFDELLSFLDDTYN